MIASGGDRWSWVIASGVKVIQRGPRGVTWTFGNRPDRHHLLRVETCTLSAWAAALVL